MSVSNGDFVDTYDDGMPGLMEGSAINEEVERQEEQRERRERKIPLSEDDDGKRKWIVNHIELDGEDWEWARDRANERGVRTEQFIAVGVKEWRIGWVDNLDDIPNPESYVNRARARSSLIVEAHESAYAIAVNYKNYPTDENAKLLHESCERLGLDPGELMERVREDRFADFVVKYRGDKDSKMNRCINWVIDFCRNRDEILSEEFNKAGEDAGYTKQMLATSRRKVGIESALRGGRYYLSMPVGQKVLRGRIGTVD